MIRAWAPGRVNIIGEHIDYNGGVVLPMAIHLGCAAIVEPIDEPVLVMRSAQEPGAEVTIGLADLRPGAVRGWAAYVAGAVWAVLEDGQGSVPGMAVTIDGDVPAGAGLSSSAAVECAVALAVDALRARETGDRLAAREVARRAQRAENAFVGVPTGSMDQVASMLAREGSVLRYDVAADTVDAVPLVLDDHAFLVVDTRVHHALVDGGYAERRSACERAAALLGVTTLREVHDADAALARLAIEPDGDVLVRRVRHVLTEIARVEAAVAALERRDLAGLGALMRASHASLRDDYAVSCAELDAVVDAAMSAGALGARMTGGGFGGSALVLVATDRLASVRAAVEQAAAAQGAPTPRQLVVRPGAGARLFP